MKPVPVLITSAINVTAPGTKLADPAERLDLTLKGIERWLQNPAVHALVAVDGSGFDYSSQLRELNLKPRRISSFFPFKITPRWFA
jgi:hypothetical protein